MTNSLKDQLMKAGLVDKQRAHKVRQQKSQEAKKIRKGELEADNTAERVRQAQVEKAERDRQLEAQRQAERREKEIAAQIKQMTENSRIDRSAGDISFQFVQDKKIKKIYVTAAQQQQLSRGQIAVAALGDGFELVPANVARKIQERDEKAILLLNKPGAEAVEEDDPYADYPIPDDLMW